MKFYQLKAGNISIVGSGRWPEGPHTLFLYPIYLPSVCLLPSWETEEVVNYWNTHNVMHYTHCTLLPGYYLIPFWNISLLDIHYFLLSAGCEDGTIRCCTQTQNTYILGFQHSTGDMVPLGLAQTASSSTEDSCYVLLHIRHSGKDGNLQQNYCTRNTRVI